MEAALRTRLIDNAAVAALVGNRVHWTIRPQDGAFPAVVLSIVSGGRTQNMDGFDGYQSTRVQADCYALSYGAAADLREAVIAALAPEHTVGAVKFLRSFINNTMSRGEDLPTAYVHRQMIDLTIWHN